MIKIIEGPKPVTCENCGCTFTFEASDIKSDFYYNKYAFLGIFPLNKRCKIVKCPICHEPHVIKMY